MSQSDLTEKTIGPDTYRIAMLDPMVAGDMLLDLTAVFGPALGSLGAAVLKAKDSKAALSQLMDGKGDDQAKDLLGDNLEGALTGLIERLDSAKQREFIATLSAVTSVKKGDKWPQLETVFTVHFRGRIKAMYQWLGFAVKAQFEDFF